MDVACLESRALSAGLVQRNLESLGHRCVSFNRAQTLLASVRRSTFSLYVVTAPQPDIECEELVQWLRNTLGTGVPIMVLAPNGDERFMVRMLSAGADRCMTGSINGNELRAHVSALLRRAYLGQHDEAADLFEEGQYAFDLKNEIVTYQGQTLCVSTREFKLALYMFRHLDWLVPRDFLETFIWGKSISPDSRALDALVSRVRTRFFLNRQSTYSLVSVYSHGFKLIRKSAVEMGHASPDTATRLIA
ncbi:response regulator transcription factor [Ralstonia sp. UBA689]|uniref:response regulator transcription factor n=1 Tax=Ralstonia sp. UBA689 TaxID=1947373 RepID=UPI0025D08EE5|nr:response regulator transcription factor [Ralstonia sp. UBA689]